MTRLYNHGGRLPSRPPATDELWRNQILPLPPIGESPCSAASRHGQRQPPTSAGQPPIPPAPKTTHPSKGETTIPEKKSSDKASRRRPSQPAIIFATTE
jgi:hypothetical protein